MRERKLQVGGIIGTDLPLAREQRERFPIGIGVVHIEARQQSIARKDDLRMLRLTAKFGRAYTGELVTQQAGGDEGACNGRDDRRCLGSSNMTAATADASTT